MARKGALEEVADRAKEISEDFTGFDTDFQTKVSEGLQHPDLVEEPHPLNLDDLYNLPQDEEAIKKAQEAILIPAGTYITTPELTVTLSEKEAKTWTFSEDGEPGDPRQVVVQRQIARFFGPMMDKDGGIVRYSFGFSWTPVYKENGKPDYYTQRYVEAVNVYKRVMGRAGSVGEIIMFFRDNPVKVRIVQVGTGPKAKPDQEPGNIAMGFSVAG